VNYYLIFTLLLNHGINKNYTIVRAELLLHLSSFHHHGKKGPVLGLKLLGWKVAPLRPCKIQGNGAFYTLLCFFHSGPVRYKEMEPFIPCYVSLEINNGQMKSLNASDVKLFAVQLMPKWMGVNGMLTAGEGLLANGGQFSNKI